MLAHLAEDDFFRSSKKKRKYDTFFFFYQSWQIPVDLQCACPGSSEKKKKNHRLPFRGRMSEELAQGKSPLHPITI